MGSGGRQVTINTRERAMSGDINRLQRFLSGDEAEKVRYMLLADTQEDPQAGGVATLFSTVGTPLRAAILNGFLVRPGIASADLTIDPGAAYFVAPEAVPDTDDSPAKLLLDEGLPSVGVLSLVANVTGFTCIDVLEMSYVQDNAFETQNRDIYNTATGLFTPTTVNKVAKFKAQYRFRRGVGVYPGHAAGWLPLMVATVPNGSTIWDTCTCFDVRPLVADYIVPGFRASRALPRQTANRVIVGKVAAGVTALVRGHVEGELNHYKVGGHIPDGGFDPIGKHCEPGFSAAMGAPQRIWNLYAAFPHGLPRWVEYLPSTSGTRLPGGFRGIPVASNNTPIDEKGRSSGLVMPAYTALTDVVTTDSFALFSGGCNTASAPKILGAISDDKGWTMSRGGVIIATATSPVFNGYVEWTWNETSAAQGPFYPRHAKAIRVRFSILKAIAFGAGATVNHGATIRIATNFTVPLWDDNDSVICHQVDFSYVRVAAVPGSFFSITADVPLWTRYPDGLAAVARSVRWAWIEPDANLAPALADAQMEVIGWKL